MKENIFDKHFKVLALKLSIIMGLAILIPILFYVINFSHNSLSDKTDNWGQFGDFFGGVVNTIISLASLIVLGILTYTMSKLSSDENNNLAELNKKRDAYDEIARLTINTNAIDQRIALATTDILFILQLEGSDLNMIYNIITKIKDSLTPFSEFYHHFKAFNVRYSYLFNYNFDNIEFNNLIETTKILRDEILQFQKEISGLNLKTPKLPAYDNYIKFTELFADFLTELNKEIDPKMSESEDFLSKKIKS